MLLHFNALACQTTLINDTRNVTLFSEKKKNIYWEESLTISPNSSPRSGQAGLDGAAIWIQPGRGSRTGSRTRCTVHLGSFASRCITHINTDSCTSLTARASSGNGTGCKSAPRPGRQSAYSDLKKKTPFLDR